MFSDVSLDSPQLVRRKATSLRLYDSLKPELRNPTLVFNVHVRRLAPVAAGKEESVLPDVLNARHTSIISHTGKARRKFFAL